MSGRILFVTGTDTDVGKTIVTGWLASILAPRLRLAVVKPVQTGATDPARDGDEAFYRAALGQAEATIATLVSLPEPLAPSIAAERANLPIDVDALVDRCLAIASDHDLTLVEGAGGLLVTITPTFDMAELAARLDASLIIVIRSALGTLNHTMLTVEAAERRGLRIEVLICSNYPASPGVVEAENVRFLTARYPNLPLLLLPRIDITRDNPFEGVAATHYGPPPAQLPL